jgi:dTDP-4-dehydrorhamnose reductase
VVEFSHSPKPGQRRYDFLRDSPDILRLEPRVSYVVVICSGFSNIDQCRREPEISHRINVSAPTELLNYIEGYEAIPVFISTDCVFDGAKNIYVESDRPNPLNLYGEQKLAIEDLIVRKFRSHLILRSSKVLGFDPHNWIMQQIVALTEGRAIPCFTDRQYAPLVIDDIEAFVGLALERGCSGTYHLGQNEALTPYQQMARIADDLGFARTLLHEMTMNEVRLLERRALKTHLCNEKAKAVGNFEFTSFDEFMESLSAMRIVKEAESGSRLADALVNIRRQ